MSSSIVPKLRIPIPPIPPSPAEIVPELVRVSMVPWFSIPALPAPEIVLELVRVPITPAESL